jgi:hypothetical protein
MIANSWIWHCRNKLQSINVNSEVYSKKFRYKPLSLRFFMWDSWPSGIFSNAFECCLQDEASHLRNLRHIRQQEEIELQNVRVWSEVSELLKHPIMLPFYSHYNAGTFPQSSASVAIFAARNRRSNVSACASSCEFYGIQIHFLSYVLHSRGLCYSVILVQTWWMLAQDEASHYRVLRKQQQQEEFELRNAHLEIEVRLDDWFICARRWRFFSLQPLCYCLTAVHGSKQLRKKLRKQRLNSRSCRWVAKLRNTWWSRIVEFGTAGTNCRASTSTAKFTARNFDTNLSACDSSCEIRGLQAYSQMHMNAVYRMKRRIFATCVTFDSKKRLNFKMFVSGAK